MEKVEEGVDTGLGVAYNLVEVKETSEDLVNQRKEFQDARKLSTDTLLEQIQEEKLDSEAPVTLNDVTIGRREDYL